MSRPPYIDNHSDEEPEEPVEPLGPAALAVARQHAFEEMCRTGVYSAEADPLYDPSVRAEAEAYWDRTGTQAETHDPFTGKPWRKLMSEHAAENAAPVIERVDRYTITVNGHRIRANAAQESTLRFLDAAGVQRFLTAMGCVTPPGSGATS